MERSKLFKFCYDFTGCKIEYFRILVRVWCAIANGAEKRVFCWKAKEVLRRVGKREHLNIRGKQNAYTMENTAKRTRPI